MLPSRGPAAVLALLLLVGTVGCQTEDPGLSAPATLRLELFDGGLTFQNAVPRQFQAVTWVVESATIHSDDFGDFDFLGVQPCVFTDNVVRADNFGRTCSGTGLLLEADKPVLGVLRIVISSMLLRASTQPVLDPEDDSDGDGLINRYDNCPLIANPAQEDINTDGDGDACSIVDPRTGALSLRDSDRDGYPDGIDNCALVSNVDQRDAVRGSDFIGDACEAFSDVNLPNGTLTLTLPVAFTPLASQFTLLVVDFNSQATVRCNAARTVCKIDPSAVVVTSSTG